MKKVVKRKSMSKRHSRKVFTRTAKKVHSKNAINPHLTMRGGIRL